MAEIGRRHELRATLTIAALMFGILGAGLLGDAALGRHRVNLGPGITIVPPAGAESGVGPRGFGSWVWQLGGSRLAFIPVYDGPAATDVLAQYAEDEIIGRFGGELSGPPEPSEHPAGEALRQHWQAPAGGDNLEGEMVVVAEGPTAALFDLRWPPDEEPGVLAELRRTIVSLRIQRFR